MNFGQRFRYNQLLQRYAVHNELWRKKFRDKDEGRTVSPWRRLHKEFSTAGPISVVCSDPEREQGKVEQLLHALMAARQCAGEGNQSIDPARFQ